MGTSTRGRTDIQPHPDNVDGPWFVDRRCIDCDAARQVAPELIGRSDRQSVVVRQPETQAEQLAMWRAALACPTRSVRRDPPGRSPAELFPETLAPGVSYCGYNHPDSFGANAFLVERPEGNALVDAPRFVRPLVEAIEARGGLAHVLLTHRDDVADAARYADHFDARVWIHADDADAAPFATDVVDGGDLEVQPGLWLLACPGHTRGSVCYLLEERYLFSGDSLFWHRRRADLALHLRQTWFSLDVQLRSLRRIGLEAPFSFVLAGHGDRHETSQEDMRSRLLALVDRGGAPAAV
jgi:glyoxylase-like metal-dependent hydrolase (beta-lactamase superfamily II)